MGLRGPKQNPHSRRGRAAAEKAAVDAVRRKTVVANAAPPAAPAGEIFPPTWLSKEQTKIWRGLVDDLKRARVVLSGIDAHAIAMAAYCLAAIDEWARREQNPKTSLAARLGISKLIERYQRDAQQWLVLIGATPGARLRLGIEQEPEPKKLGPLARILAQKQMQGRPM